MYQVLPSYTLGFHGCDQSVADAVLSGTTHLKRSRNVYDWLGEGVYFWENSPSRALEYATELRDRPRRGGPKVKTPAVVGAIIELGYCLNLLDAEFLALLAQAYTDIKRDHEAIGVALPVNSQDRLRRPLDCAVINAMQQTRVDKGLRPFDSVRAAFAEGGDLFPGSGITGRHHIQIAVLMRSSIKGYFRPLKLTDLPID